VDDSTLDDPLLRAEISRLHRALDQTRDDLEWETRFDAIVKRIQHQLAARDTSERAPTRTAAEAMRDYLESRLLERSHLDEVARDLGWNKTHLIRSFTTEFGIPPHRYLIGRRLEEARRRLLDGQTPAEVAVGVGFYDQAHLTRHFRTYLSTTPGLFQQSGSRINRT